MYGLTVTVAPTAEPVTVAEALTWLREDGSEQDARITSLIQAGRERCEQVSGRALVTQTLKLILDTWPLGGVIQLPRLPLAATPAVAVTYLDAGTGLRTTFSTAYYLVDVPRGLIRPGFGVAWPGLYPQQGAVEVTYTAGYGDPSAVPAEIKNRILAYVGHCYENRENIDNDYLDRLFQGFTTGLF